MGQHRLPSRPKAITRPVFKAQLTHPHKSRMQFPQNPHPHWAQNGRISTIRVPHLKYAEGNCMRNWPPADERRPQGLRAHVRTLTMSTFCCPLGTTHLVPPLRRYKTRPTRTAPGHCGTKLARQEPYRATSGTKLALLAQNDPIWRVLPAHGELFHAHTHTRPSRADFLAHRTQPRGDDATNDTSTATGAGQHETTITTAHP